MDAERRVLDLSFPLRGTSIPADHGYHLASAVARWMPSAHGDTETGIHPVFGQLAGGRMLALTPRSRLMLRLRQERLVEALPLAGKELDIGGSRVRIGVPTAKALRPAASVWSRLVTISGFMEPEAFLAAAGRQLAVLGIAGRASLMTVTTAPAVGGNSGREAGMPVRRTLRIHDKEVVGFAVRVDQLTAEESIRLQEAGIGGRRRFGCGIFIPARW